MMPASTPPSDPLATVFSMPPSDIASDSGMESLPALSPLPEARIEALIDDLVSRGFSLQPQFFSEALIEALLSDVEAFRAQDALSDAGIGRLREHRLERRVRGDAIRWLTPDTPAQRVYLHLMSLLRESLNRALYMGLFEFEAHFARYPSGTFYKRHLDSFQGRSNRVISTVTYLNRDWPASGGGEMVLYEQHPPGPSNFDPEAMAVEIARVLPEAGTLVCFLSESVPHEVLPTRLPRASIAGWFRRNASVNGLVDPAR